MGCALVSGFFCLRRFPGVRSLRLDGLHFFAISIDCALGSPLMTQSYLGYDPIIGARYYGIGNEYAGVYIISGLTVLLPALKWKNKRALLLIFALIAGFQLLMLGGQSFGANAGATLSAGFGYVTFGLQIVKRNTSFRQASLAFGLAGCVTIGSLYILQLSSEPTHISIAFERLLNGDFSYIFNIIQRKIEMNIKIFLHSNWTQLFVTSYVLLP